MGSDVFLGVSQSRRCGRFQLGDSLLRRLPCTLSGVLSDVWQRHRPPPTHPPTHRRQVAHAAPHPVVTPQVLPNVTLGMNYPQWRTTELKHNTYSL